MVISPGDPPRLFIDAIGFVEMGRDRREYPFLQHTRHGRITIGETEKVEDMVEAITAYIAHRRISGRKALAYPPYRGRVGAKQRGHGASEGRRFRQSCAGRGRAKALPGNLMVVTLIGAAAFLGLIAAIGLHLGGALTR